MMPAGPLMKEHRLIEKMIKVMQTNFDAIRKDNNVDPAFIDTVVDFIRTYADRCHHGKEEDILFKNLAKKKMTDEHQKIMQELIQEHKMGRNNTKKLAEAKERYVQGNKESLKDIITNLEILIKFYPRHIEKEDKHFFIPSMDYLTEEEKDKMLTEMWEFDRNMIHEKYAKIVQNYQR